jgi:hypothetical protein
MFWCGVPPPPHQFTGCPPDTQNTGGKHLMYEEMPIGRKLSSSAYVAAKLEGDVIAKKIVIREPRNCDHTAFVCVECVASWEIDWTFFFERTAGGRALQAARQ